MSEKNKAVMRRFVQELSNGNLDAFDELVAPDFVNRSASPGAHASREAWKQGFARLRAAFPDFRMDIEQEIAEGDFVTTRFTSHATHQAEYRGIPATGKMVTVSGIHIAHITGGKIVERWEEVDTMGLMAQLGAVLSPGG